MDGERCKDLKKAFKKCNSKNTKRYLFYKTEDSFNSLHLSRCFNLEYFHIVVDNAKILGVKDKCYFPQFHR